MNRPGLDKIESYFGMELKTILEELHWKQQRSIKSLSDECKVSRDTFQKQAARLNLPLRNIVDATRLTKNKGKNHWAYGLRKETSAWAKAHSDRMKTNNPAKDIKVREKMSKSLSKTFLDKLLPQEIKFAEILKKHDIPFVMQVAFGSYILDFLIRDIDLCIEIDSTSKWGEEKHIAAKKRDDVLMSKGIKTLRINKNKLDDELFINNILKSNDLI